MNSELPQPLAWTCEGKTLLGLLHRAMAPSTTAVIVVPGGTQYRVGAHRGFVELAQCLASQGYPTLRFDCRGMGDSGGHHPGFTNLHEDIASAVVALKSAAPQTLRIVLFGLCDGATAALLASQKVLEIDGFILCNMWVRSPASQAATVISHHYKARFLDKRAWQRLLLGRINVAESVKSVFGSLVSMRHKPASLDDLVVNVTTAWENNTKPVLSVIGDKDFTGAEFAQFLKARPAKAHMTIKTVIGGDHSFSGNDNKDDLSWLCLSWLAKL